MFPEPQLRPSQSILFTFVEHAIIVGFSRAKQVKDDARQLVRSCGDCLRFAALTRDAPKELAEIILGMVQGLRTHPQRSGNSAANAPAFGI